LSWSLKFDEPIELAKGKPLRTLRDAANYIIALPAREATCPLRMRLERIHRGRQKGRHGRNRNSDHATDPGGRR